MLKQILLVGAGGAIGSVLRFLTSVFTHRFFSGTFPLATFIINILGCFLIGLLIGLFGENNPQQQHLKLLLVTGFCGGYTTFSAFSLENLSLFNKGYSLIAIGYILASVLIGIAAVWAGLQTTSSFQE